MALRPPSARAGAWERKGLDAAAEYVAAAFKAMGLEPGGDSGTYFQSFPSPKSPAGTPVALRNVIGVLPGSKADWKGQSAPPHDTMTTSASAGPTSTRATKGSSTLVRTTTRAASR